MSSQCRRFEGRTALITGGANGMGRATVHRLADEGLATVVIVDRDADGAAREIEKVRANGGDGLTVHKRGLGISVRLCTVLPDGEHSCGSGGFPSPFTSCDGYAKK